MAVIPSFVLKRLYVKGSLRNTPEGFSFSLQNNIAMGTLSQFYDLEVDGQFCLPESLTIHMPDGSRHAVRSSGLEVPLSLPMGLPVTVAVQSDQLGPGKHKLRLSFRVSELGDLEIKVADNLREGEAPVRAGPEPGVQRQEIGGQAAIRPVRIALLGAGSTVFARQLMADFLCTPGLEEGTFALVDIDSQRLELAQRIGEKLAEQSGRHWTVEATADRLQALPGCDYVISTIEVAGLRNVGPDYEIPLKYGVDQCIGDTIGPGGVFKMLRTGPTWLEILQDVERLCPQAVVMNYTNPMSALTLLALRTTHLSVVGLCHSVQGTSLQLAQYLDIPRDELRFRCAGINHLAWFTELTHQGEDLYPRLRQAARAAEIYEADPVRFEVMLNFGAFVTESSGHFSEYVPYFRKRPDLLERYTREGYRGESGFYAKNWPRWRTEADDTIRAQLARDDPIVLERSSEYASYIVQAVETGAPTVIHGNVLNQGLIDNLPHRGCVEVSVLIDAMGLHPVRFGPLPTQLAALNAAHMYVHDLLVEAVQESDREAALQALMLDPLTAAVCSPAEIRGMFEEMWAAERRDLTSFGG
jgi:alpha-galactosidase